MHMFLVLLGIYLMLAAASPLLGAVLLGSVYYYHLSLERDYRQIGEAWWDAKGRVPMA